MRKFVVLSVFLMILLPSSAGAFTDIYDRVDSDTERNIRAAISSCADIMSFDCRDYDYDKLFRYVLYTHENFRIVTKINPDTLRSSSLGYNNITLVKADFIDYIMENIFRVPTEKPPVSELMERGFCYNNGYYMYNGGFNIYFATELLDITGVYNLGAGCFYVTFSDSYREGDTKIREQSFAILQRTAEGYAMLRLGMGEQPPSEAEILSYSPFTDSESFFHNFGDTKINIDGDTKTHERLMPYLLGVFSLGIAGLACSIVLLARNRK